MSTIEIRNDAFRAIVDATAFTEALPLAQVRKLVGLMTGAQYDNIDSINLLRRTLTDAYQNATTPKARDRALRVLEMLTPQTHQKRRKK